MFRLSTCALAQNFEIAAIQENELSPKLTEMGLYPGQQVRVLFRAPLGDPIAIDVQGYTLSLRKQEADLVELR